MGALKPFVNPGPIVNRTPTVDIQPLIDRLVDPAPAVEPKLDQAVEQAFNSIESILTQVRGRVDSVGYIDSRYGELKADLASIDAGLTALKKDLENYRKKD
jgi:hypothetical protein